MPRPPADARLVPIALDRDGPEPLHRQIHRALYEAILGGRLEPWARLPSSRGLARELGVSRNTVLRAFEQLAVEGLLIASAGSGCRVHPQLPRHLLGDVVIEDRPPRRSLPAWSDSMTSLGSIEPWIWQAQNLERPFVLGMPSVRHFPRGLWSRLVARRVRKDGFLATGDELGSRRLRDAVHRHVQSARGVVCTPEQILILDGTQQGLDLIARSLLRPGDEAWMEDPGYLGARWAWQLAQAHVVGVPVDAEGLNLDAAPQGRPRLIYTTPGNQFPLGSTMGMARRLELLHFAQQRDCWVVEDDYDSEFRNQPQPVTSLQGLDEHGRVLYLGTFSKTLSPSLRIGYLILPEDLVQGFAHLRFIAGNQFVTVDQEVLAEFMDEGHFATHVGRMRRLYRQRHDALLDSLAHTPRGHFEVPQNRGGMHQLVLLPEHLDETAISQRASDRGIRARPVGRYRIGPPGRPGLVLGYASVEESELRRGVGVLAEVVTEALALAER